MKNSLIMFCFYLLISHCSFTFSLNTDNNLRKQANQVDKDLDGLGARVEKGKKDSPKPINLVITKSPFEVIQCNQSVMLDAEYITDLKDFRKRAKGFYSINAYNISVYKEKNAETLIHTVNFTQMDRVIKPLKGAKGCLIIDGGSSSADITLCFKKAEDTVYLLEAFNSYRKCRKGNNLVKISDEKLKELAKSCDEANQAEKASSSNELDLNVRPGNKWDVERERYFHPDAISVPGVRKVEKKEE